MKEDIAARDRKIYAAFIQERAGTTTDKEACERIALEFSLSAKRIGVIVRRERSGVGQSQEIGTDLDLLVDALKRENDALRSQGGVKLLPQPDKYGRIKTPLPVIETFIFTGEMPSAPVPVFTGEWHLDYDECMIAGDFHLPSCKLGYVQRMCQLAERHMKGKRHLIIAGDIHNGDKDARYAPLVPPISRAQELNLTRDVLDYLLGYFDEIHMTPGNHMRKRFLELLDGDLNFSQYTQLITSHPSRVHLSPYDIIHLQSGREQWAITHQYQYSKNKLIKANQLAQKYQCNVVTFHQHHTAIGRDEFDHYTIVDCGGFHDQSMMAYVSLVPNTFPRMNNAFIFMRNGTAHLMSHYPTITDWSMWLPETNDTEAKTLAFRRETTPEKDADAEDEKVA